MKSCEVQEKGKFSSAEKQSTKSVNIQDNVLMGWGKWYRGGPGPGRVLGDPLTQRERGRGGRGRLGIGEQVLLMGGARWVGSGVGG